MKITALSNIPRRKRGIALVIVISALALVTVLMLAMFSATETEFKSTQAFVSSQAAKQLGDMSVSIVEAQIQNGQNTATAAAARTIHATQPGMVRVYTATGVFKEAYKLYSSSQMKWTNGGPTGEKSLVANAAPPADWNSASNEARYVDLNEPVVRAPRPGAPSTAKPSVYFPVIDPRAAYNFLGSQNPAPGAPTTRVEGFSYSATTAAGIGKTVNYAGTVVEPATASDPSALRLPMPVEWIYVLQDGTFGALDASGKFVPATAGNNPTEDNPIVGRIAFWTDDESCKINVNTAGEPTFQGTPYYFHDRDRRWAHFPGVAAEYQRYPGHPATVAVSAVLCPGYRLDPLYPDPGLTTANVVDIKERIYDFLPKLGPGGSKSGTQPFVLDWLSPKKGEATAAALLDPAASRNERLFATIDEMLFKDGVYGAAGREAAVYNLPGSSGRVMFDHDTLERSRFFLTAQSRSPEFSIFGLPRVCMWPVADGEQPNNIRRTSFDNTIALCATLRGPTTGPSVANSYLVRRGYAHSSVYDVTGNATGLPTNLGLPVPSAGLQRNSKLLDYLVAEMSGLTFPQGMPKNTLSSAGTSFATKYGADNVKQMAVNIFDYIRCTNLYDGVLARGNDGSSGVGKSGAALFIARDQAEPQSLTYTNQRLTPSQANVNAINTTTSDDSAVFPGHGQVSPAIWQSGSNTYRGMGRMFTISEAGFQFICTADGKSDSYSVTFNGVTSGGGSAPRVDPKADPNPTTQQGGTSLFLKNSDAYGGLNIDPNKQARWWSNYPPLINDAPTNLRYGVKTDKPYAFAPGTNFHPLGHPGYDPNNWNLTLANNTPLLEDEKRVQAVFMLETFCPMLGWTKLWPEYTIVLDGDYISQITITSGGVHKLFDTAGPLAIKSDSDLYEKTNVYSVGGHAGPSAMVGGRATRPVSGEGSTMFGSDPNYDTTGAGKTAGLSNYGVTSNFITVKRDQPMALSFPAREFVIKIYDNLDWQSRQPIQTIRMKFTNTNLPVPGLVGSENDKGGVGNLNFDSWIDTLGRNYYFRSRQAPHYWCYNMQGALGRLKGRVNPAYVTGMPPVKFWATVPNPNVDPDSPNRQLLRGRFDTTSGVTGGFPGSAQGFGIFPDTVSDVTRTMIPAVGDYRLVAARYDVPPEMWMPHPRWAAVQSQPGMSQPRSIHAFTSMWGDSEAGALLDVDPLTGNAKPEFQLVSGLNPPYSAGRMPDLPGHPDWARAANSFGDFDSGISSAREGPYINKPDEGNFYAGNETRWNVTKYYRSGYFYNSWQQSDDWRTGVYMTPNRLISSPVMFGSLPTGVWPGGNVPLTASALQGAGSPVSQLPGRPWQTLLFRPYSPNTVGAYGAKSNHPGEYAPMDHYLLDLFFMPVVEPYAISEPLSVAGRLNINYQILPFTNIRRATAMHALMKGEFMTAIPNADTNTAKGFKASTTADWDTFFNDDIDRKFWHRPINVAETVRQFDERFNSDGSWPASVTGLFRAASQICELHLVPDVSRGPSVGNEGGVAALQAPMTSKTDRDTKMASFWQAHAATGDNIRERPYSNLYSRITTRSNTFRVHVRAQVIKKSRSTDPAIVDRTKDQVLSEYRGSTLIERFIDPTDRSAPLPDYAASTNPLAQDPLDKFYRFRVLESKRFNP